ncbi:hypothetical protein D2962_03940 [Biomaibacter acetigenes]|uniref:Uncharacterized protein n=1 Tax=Biomaibacter acetigenes TaxID=2316383 RepID=A0A3G2R3C3_9FIRM|nr:hypothetical protein D2962_03940 [Biomaibacter acetigenes]
MSAFRRLNAQGTRRHQAYPLITYYIALFRKNQLFFVQFRPFALHNSFPEDIKLASTPPKFFHAIKDHQEMMNGMLLK